MIISCRVIHFTGTNPMRKVILMAMLTASMAVAACNTVEGAGRDVSAAGNAVTGAAQEAK